MEPAGAMTEANWSSPFSGFMPNDDESDFVTQLLGEYPFANEQDFDPNSGVPSSLWASHDVTEMVGGEVDSLYYNSSMVNSSLHSWPQGNSNLTSVQVNYCSRDNSLLDLSVVEEQNGTSSSLHSARNTLFEESFCLNKELSGSNQGEPGTNPSEVGLAHQLPKPKRKFQMPDSDKCARGKNTTNQSQMLKKSRSSGDVQKKVKNGHSKKNQTRARTADEDDNSAALNGQSSSSYSSEDDDSNASQDLNGGGTSSSSKRSKALNLNGKTRASRGSATDPQSLYARKRRERINERLRILQNLVPNGTKVDISTMLEEAVHYVKFLQLQIKLLSSDEMWMYSPIAYNGMDIGLSLKASSSPS